MQAYLEFFKKAIQRSITYRWSVLFSVLNAAVSMYFLFYFWRSLYGNLEKVAEISLSAMITYALMSRVIAGFLNNQVDSHIEQRLQTGDVIIDLIRPCNFYGYLLAETLGNSLSRLALNILPSLTMAFLLFRIQFPPNLLTMGLFLFSVILSYIVLFSINFLTGMIGFWTLEVGNFKFLRWVAISLLSGSFVPLWFFPDMIQVVLRNLPFAAIYHLPLSIYIGRISGTELFPALIGQVVWAIVLVCISLLVLGLARRKVIIQGG